MPKNHIRVRAYGDIDETNSAIGLAIAMLANHKYEVDQAIPDFLREIQNRLFDLGAEMATVKSDLLAKLKRKVEKDDIKKLEEKIDGWQKKLPFLKTFILPGGSPAAAHLQMARTICRRAERTTSLLKESEHFRTEPLQYLNRLSDFLFVLARYINFCEKNPEPTWKK